MQDFKKLRVWQKAHTLTLDVYRISQSFPKEELYGLVSQMRRCAVSIASNIAEGSRRGTDPELSRFLRIALSSACELDYQVLLSFDLRYLNKEEFKKLSDSLTHIKKMLIAFITSIDAHAQTPKAKNKQPKAKS